MVVSMNCSEGGPLRIYPCTSEVQSVTQGTKERFAKNCVARSDFPIFFLFGSLFGSPKHLHERGMNNSTQSKEDLPTLGLKPID